MGRSTWDAPSYAKYAAVAGSKDRGEIFTNTDGCHDDLNPTKFKVRESVDSDVNPNATPIVVAVDDTGSMGMLAELIIKKGLGVIVEGIIDRKPIPDPHIMLAAFGDGTCDRAPIQATQFEADEKITEQIEKFYLEGGGGGNAGESYAYIWYLIKNKADTDSFIKRGRKGYIFTIGDERFLKKITADESKRFFDIGAQDDIDVKQLLSEVQKEWHVFHLITPTSATEGQNAITHWRELLGERAIVVDDHERLGEIIVSLVQVNEGQDWDDVADSWDGTSALAVKEAVSDYAGIVKSKGTDKGKAIVKM